CVHLVERFRLHLDQCELDVLLDIDLGALALVQNVSFLVAIRPGVANLLVYRVQQLPTAILEDFLQLVIAACLCRYLLLRRRRHDALLPSPAPQVRGSLTSLYDASGHAIVVPKCESRRGQGYWGIVCDVTHRMHSQ